MRLGKEVIALGFTVLLVATGDGSAAGGNLGKPPHKCGAGFGGGLSGCYGSDVGPNVMDDMNQADLILSPHIVTRGQKITANLASVFSEPRGFSLSVGGQGLSCPRTTIQGATTCTIKATAPTGGWAEANLSFSGGVEQDFYAVLPKGEAAISGTILDADNRPMKGVKVAISGAKKSPVTDVQGYYFAKVSEGSHTVTPAAKVCLIPSNKSCKRSATVKTPPSRDVSFKEGGRFTLSGNVREGCSSCGTSKPLEGAVVAAANKTTKKTGSGTTDKDGNYSIKLKQGTYDVALVKPSGGSPPARVVNLHGDVGGTNFRVCDQEEGATSRSNPWAAFPAANTRSDFRGEGGCPLQKFVLSVFRKDKPPDTLKLEWSAGFPESCSSPRRVIERTIDLAKEFTFAITTPPAIATGVKEEGSVTGYLTTSESGRAIIGAVIQTARLTVTYAGNNGAEECSAGIAGDEVIIVGAPPPSPKPNPQPNPPSP